MQYAAILLLLLLSWPLLVCAGKRIRAAVRLGWACRREGHRLVQLHPFWFWGLNRSSRADFLIRTKGGRAVYTVKLYGVLHRLSTVYFIKSPEGRMSVRQRRVIPLAGRFSTYLDDDLNPVPGQMGGSVIHTHDSLRLSRPPVDYASPTEGEGCTVIPVLLLNPAPLNIRESEEIPCSPRTTERPTMFGKREDRRLESRTLFDGGLLHLTEHVFGLAGFLKELSDLRLPGDYGIR